MTVRRLIPIRHFALGVAILAVSAAGCAGSLAVPNPIPLNEVDDPPVLKGCPGFAAGAGPNKKWAWASYTVTAEGRVVDVRTWRPGPFTRIATTDEQLAHEAKALAIAHTCIYEPGRKNGVAVAVGDVRKGWPISVGGLR